MFPKSRYSNNTESLLPAPERAQNQVGILARIVDIVKDCRPADLAGIVDYYITKTQHSLED